MRRLCNCTYEVHESLGKGPGGGHEGAKWGPVGGNVRSHGSPVWALEGPWEAMGRPAPPSPKVPCMRLHVVGPWALNAFESHLKCSARQRNMHMAVRTIDPRQFLVINGLFTGR